MNTCFRGVIRQALAVGAALAAAGPALAAGQQAEKLDVPALSRLIDQGIGQRLDAEHVQPGPLADDAEFLRRVYLDLTGVIPAADRARAFLDSKDPDKRAKLIDELLASPAFGRHMADIWQALLLPRTSDNRRLNSAPMTQWLEEHFNNNTPWDEFVTELITASGPQDKNGAVTFFLANATVDKYTDQTSKLFLGIQLQCAQCHNHPFTGWKQEEYWGMAQFFIKVRADRVQQAARQGNVPGVSENAAPRGRRAPLPMSAKRVPAKFLQGEQPKLNASGPYRPVLAKWMTSPGNKFFARAMVNRTWAQLFGRGIVNPVDDMHDGNAPSHPELLKQLSEQFVASGFDLKHLIRGICNSQAYQRTSKVGKEEADPSLFARAAVKVMTPEQLYDSLEAVLGRADRPAQARRGPQQRGPAITPRAQFVNFFLVEEGSDPTEYQAGIPQVLRLMNSARTNAGGALLREAMKPGRPPAEVIEHLYLATLSRRPTADETRRLTASYGIGGFRRQKPFSLIR